MQITIAIEIFFIVLCTLAFYELPKQAIKMLWQVYTDTDTDTEGRNNNNLYELNVLYVNGQDRECFLNDYPTALELLAFYNLDVSVQSVLLYRNGTDITYTGTIEKASNYQS